MLFPLLVSLLALEPVRAYPIAPQPLHELVAGSDLIAVVRPAPWTPIPPGASTFQRVSVELHVEEVLRGLDSPASITTTHPLSSCPAPPKYPEGERVLAFLVLDDERNGHTFGWSYGTKLLDPEALDVYGARIRELVALIDANPKQWRASPKFLDWLVRCAEEPATRWEGAYPIDPTGDRRYGNRLHERPPSFGHLLEAKQRARLAKALVVAPSIETGEMLLLHFLVEDPNPALDEFALARLPGLLEKDLYDARRLMLLLAQRSGDEDAWRMAREFEKRKRVDPASPETAGFVGAFVEHVRGRR